MRFVSLYSGAGGLDHGFIRAGFTPVWANDADAKAVGTYNLLMADLAEGHEAIAGDILEQALPERGAAELVIGGPPCQGFSVAGKMNPNDPRSRHVWTFFDVVERLQPEAFCMENVSSLAWNARWSELLNGLLERAANELGYRTQVLLLNASHYGVPQKRERVFLIGFRDQRLAVPVETTKDGPPTVRAALEQLPRYGESGNDTPCPARVTPAKNPVLRRSPFAGMLFNGKGRPLNLDAPAPTLPASMGGNKTPIIDQQQLDTGEPAWVIDYHQHLWAGGDPYERVPDRLRRLTVEEAAAIQTFPAGMTWIGSLSEKFSQIGNAVPPELAYHVAIAIRSALVSEPDEPATAKEFVGATA